MKRAKPKFELQEWYSSEAAKRRFGSICQAVNEHGQTVGLLGTASKPRLHLHDSDDVEPSVDEVAISIDEAKANWPTVTIAAMLLETQFRVHGKKLPRAVLCRNPDDLHPALKYRRPQLNPGATAQLDELLNQLRKIDGSLEGIATRMESAADIIERRFREIWRTASQRPARSETETENATPPDVT